MSIELHGTVSSHGEGSRSSRVQHNISNACVCVCARVSSVGVQENRMMLKMVTLSHELANLRPTIRLRRSPYKHVAAPINVVVEYNYCIFISGLKQT